MLQLNEVTKQFRGADFVLDKISFSLGKGIHMLIGPNGAGKSTLLRIIASVIRPDAGYVSYNGRDVYSDLAGYKLGLGYLPQTLGFYNHMSGIEFLRYMAGLKGLSPRLGREQADYVTDLLEMRPYCDKKIVSWSAGMRQRLGLAQALLNDPAVLILDEPFCGLDPEEADEVGQLFAHLSRHKVILISSHIIEGLTVNRLLLLINGQLQFAGLPTVFLDEAQGQVWLVEMVKDEWLKLQHKYPASKVIREGDRYRCYIVDECKPDIPEVKKVSPGLEEAYLFWLRRWQRSSGEV